MQKSQSSASCRPAGGPADAAGLPGAPCPTMPLAMAYMPIQQWEGLYDTDAALMRGTLFAALDKPFIGEEAVPQ